MPIVLDGTKGETPASWTTAGRPTSPVAGQWGFNTTFGIPEWWDPVGAIWMPMANVPAYAVDYLIVAGGGGGGGGQSGEGSGGGGGAGGLLQGSYTVSSGSTFAITVGGGGASASGDRGINGSNSTAFSLG